MIRQWKFTFIYYGKIFLNIRHTGSARCYPFNTMAFFLAPLGEESCTTTDMNENFVELIFLCNSSASSNRKHQNSLCYKIFIHCIPVYGKLEEGRHYGRQRVGRTCEVCPEDVYKMNYLQCRLYSCILMPHIFKMNTMHTAYVLLQAMLQSGSCYTCSHHKRSSDFSGGIFYLDKGSSVLPKCAAFISEFSHIISQRKAVLLSLFTRWETRSHILNEFSKVPQQVRWF